MAHSLDKTHPALAAIDVAAKRLPHSVAPADFLDDPKHPASAHHGTERHVQDNICFHPYLPHAGQGFTHALPAKSCWQDVCSTLPDFAHFCAYMLCVLARYHAKADTSREKY
ncbi:MULTISPECIES: hypothetical protein [Roseinatronobacter]|uniref:Uncharacterized protein n=1 Tax=Roseinatronobacter domitianus TaxID=2940293 RepID=A0ABT0LZW9_9RHOB|nr:MULTISPECIES: hypothetical protein [Roseibaca]MCL1628161.1 hypothetical protein [Roseibaca domitiana]